VGTRKGMLSRSRYCEYSHVAVGIVGVGCAMVVWVGGGRLSLGFADMELF